LLTADRRLGNGGDELVVTVRFSANAPETVDGVNHVDPNPLFRLAAAAGSLHDGGGLRDERRPLVRFSQGERWHFKFDNDDAGPFPAGIRLVRRDPAYFPNDVRGNEAVPLEMVELQIGIAGFQEKAEPGWLEAFSDFYLSEKVTCLPEDACPLPSFSPEVARAVKSRARRTKQACCNS
jgi:hypothetical protein